MENKRKSSPSDSYRSNKSRRSEYDSLNSGENGKETVVTFNFEDDGNSKFLELVNSGGLFKTLDFWKNPLVKETGTVSIRPGVNDFTDRYVYYLKKNNGKNDEDGKPSFVELEQRFVSQLKAWLKDRYDEFASVDQTGMIKIMQDHRDFACQKKINSGKDWPKIFFKNPLTLELGNFRIRPYFNEDMNLTTFYINWARQHETYVSWLGPIIRLSIGELKRIEQALNDFESRF